jgi:hypothetical protein
MTNLTSGLSIPIPNAIVATTAFQKNKFVYMDEFYTEMVSSNLVIIVVIIPGIYFPAILCELRFDLRALNWRDKMPHGIFVAVVHWLTDHSL